MMSLQNCMALDTFFWFCSLTGTGMFIIQLCLNCIGLGEYADTDDSSITDGIAFKWLSKQAIAGFLMLFGWSALTCQKEFNLEGPSRIAIALVCGFIAILMTGLIFKIANKLHSSGTIFKIEDTIGQEAVVYQRIPHNGTGKVSVCIDDFVREVDACTYDHTEVPSFAQVKILDKIDDHTVLVAAILGGAHA
jgi:hypothetical protein